MSADAPLEMARANDAFISVLRPIIGKRLYWWTRMAGLDIYAEELIHNYEHPLNKRGMEGATASASEENASCGDSITVHLKIDKGILADVSFEGSGCVIAMGTASLLTEMLRGKSLRAIEKMTREDLLKLIGIDPGPVRMHCATLSLKAAKKAAFDHERKPMDSATREL
jgi:nitrogen fixation protein NifU and related proteins